MNAFNGGHVVLIIVVLSVITCIGTYLWESRAERHVQRRK